MMMSTRFCTCSTAIPAKCESYEAIRVTTDCLFRCTFAHKFKSIFKMNIKCIITAVLALLVSTACSGVSNFQAGQNKS